MKTKKQFLAIIFIYFLVISCSNGIKPSGKYMVGRNDSKEYIFEFKEDMSVTITPNNIQKISNLCSSIQRKSDQYGSLINTLKGNADQSVIEDLKNKLLTLREFNFNKENYTETDLKDYLKASNDIIIDFDLFSTKYPKLDSIDNFWYYEMQIGHTENEILSARTVLENSNCISIGKWDTNSDGDITISNLSETKCDKIMEFNTVFFNNNPKADPKGVTNYSNNDFIMKPLKGLY